MTDQVNATSINSEMVSNYFKSLVNQFFKILPMREHNETSLPSYMATLQSELLGNKRVMEDIGNDARYLTLIGILQYLIDTPDCAVLTVRRNVFRAISICNKLQAQYASERDAT